MQQLDVERKHRQSLDLQVACDVRRLRVVVNFNSPQVTILREQCHVLERQRVSLLDQCACLNSKAADAEADMQVAGLASVRHVDDQRDALNDQ